jgi:hypothetical protein
MGTADASERSEAARAAAKARWTPSPVVVRSAEVLIERHAELPDAVRAVLHEATAPPGGGDSRDQG